MPVGSIDREFADVTTDELKRRSEREKLRIQKLEDQADGFRRAFPGLYRLDLNYGRTESYIISSKRLKKKYDDEIAGRDESIAESGQDAAALGVTQEIKLPLQDLVNGAAQEAATLYASLVEKLHENGQQITNVASFQIHAALNEALPDLKLRFLRDIPVQSDSCILKKNNPKKSFIEKMVQLAGAMHGHGHLSLDRIGDLLKSPPVNSP